MEREFVPYEMALRLKQLGFDMPCFGYFDCERDFQFVQNKSKYLDCEIPRPTFSQACRWFREKYTHIKFSFGQSYWKEEYTDFFDLTIRNKEINRTIGVGGFTSYEEAELSCLERLIEIVE